MSSVFVRARIECANANHSFNHSLNHYLYLYFYSSLYLFFSFLLFSSLLYNLLSSFFFLSALPTAYNYIVARKCSFVSIDLGRKSTSHNARFLCSFATHLTFS